MALVWTEEPAVAKRSCWAAWSFAAVSGRFPKMSSMLAERSRRATIDSCGGSGGKSAAVAGWAWPWWWPW